MRMGLGPPGGATRAWLAFGALALMWGSGFMWNKLALGELAPVPLIWCRAVAGFGTLSVFVAVLRPRMPRTRGPWLAAALMGLGNMSVPHYLIIWGQQHIDSTVAAMLVSTTPLQTLLVAHLLLADERISAGRAGAMLLAFGGVLVLLSRNLDGGVSVSLLGQLSALGAATCFALTTVLTRRLATGASPVALAWTSLAFGVLGLSTLLALTGHAPPLPREPVTWLALGALGLFTSGMSFIVFYYLIQTLGPNRTQMVSFVIPLVAVLLGVAFLGEALFWQLLAGGAAIVAGVALFQRARPGAARPAE